MLTAIVHQLKRLVGVAPDEGRSPHWPTVRAAHLKGHPTCAACGRKDHLQVHHKYPVGWPNGKATELDDSNLITLCEFPSHNDHLWVGHNGDFKSRNENVEQDAAAALKRIKSRPYPVNMPIP